MSKSTRCFKIPILFYIFIFLGISACHENKEKDSASAAKSMHGIFDAQPLDKLSIEAQLKRYLGQTEFLNIAQHHFYPLAMSAAGDSKEALGGDTQRLVQESDLYKVGKPGSKLLYVLNNYRGLQVIDFSEGPENPKLAGRTDVSGDEVLEMYFDADHMQIITMERRWNQQQGALARLLVYSVADPRHPTLIQTHELNGDIADSRQVGNVLYVATSRWNNYQSIGGEGWVNSFNLDVGGLSPASSYQLALPVQTLNSLNIVETLEAGRYYYYLISTLSQNRWSWFDRQSTVEVVDISDEQGKIKPLLLVTTKGQLRERSGTTIKDGTLIAVSNSWSTNDQGTAIRRVTVESFVLPGDNIKIIDASEADFRRLWYERQMKAKPESADSEEYADQLSRDPEYGLKGVFVRAEGERISKIFPDQSITVGDSTGLHADLQDVRFVNDKLYVFWVPANQIDPLDVFDISQPSSKLTYLGRTLFEGWMERAIPFEYQGQSYVLGLGWIMPAVGENSRRSPQVMIFKMPATSEQKPEVIAQMTLQSSNLWAAFNDQDKSIDVHLNDDGTGVVIFPATSWGEQYLSGGKIVAFDVKANNGQRLKEGGLLASNASWLRRVFNNPEIDSIHTLTDRSLSTFAVNSNFIGRADEIFKALSILELARNIRAYAEIKVAKESFGVQFVEEEGPSFDTMKTMLRFVPQNQPDAELDRVVFKTEMPGRYESHLVNSQGDLFVLTSQNLFNGEQGLEQWTMNYILTRVQPIKGDAQLANAKISSVSWQAPFEYTYGYLKFAPTYYYGKPLLIDRGTKILVAKGPSLTAVGTGTDLTLSQAADDLGCLPEAKENLRYHDLEGKLYISYETVIQADDVSYSDIRLSRYFLTPVNDDALTARCAEIVNIPGEPMKIEGGKLITSDSRLLGFQSQPADVIPLDDRVNRPRSDDVEIIAPPPPQSSRWPIQVAVLDALILEGGKARLSDLFDRQGAQGDILVGDDLCLLQQTNEWDPRFIVCLNVNEAERFESRSFVLPTSPSFEYRLVDVIESANGPLYLVQIGREGFIYRENGSNLEALSVRTVRNNGETSKAKTSFPLLEWLEPGYGHLWASYDSQLGRLNLAQGLWGVTQIEIVKKD